MVDIPRRCRALPFFFRELPQNGSELPSGATVTPVIALAGLARRLHIDGDMKHSTRKLMNTLIVLGFIAVMINGDDTQDDRYLWGLLGSFITLGIGAVVGRVHAEQMKCSD